MEASSTTVRVLCRKLLLPRDDVVVLQWLIGSPFFPPITVVSTVRCIHHQPSDHLSPDYSKESDDIRSLIIKGFHVIGALIIEKNGDPKQTARQAIDAARKIRNCLNYDGGSVEDSGDLDLIGGVVDSDGGNVRFFMSSLGDLSDVEAVESVMYEDEPEKYLWEHGCLLRCELPIKLPVYVPVNKQADAERMYLQENNALVAALKDPQMTCILETVQNSAEKVPRTVAIRVAELDFVTDLVNVKLLNGAGQKADVRSLSFSYFFPDCKYGHTVTSAENADIIQISIMLNSSTRSPKFAAPVAEYYPALDEVRLFVVDYKLDVLCYAARQLPLTYAISKLLIPALISQLTTMKNAVFPSFLAQHPQLRAYHFCPPGILHPVTAIYELSYGETETKQVEVRLSLHQRLGLPCDRPLLRVAYALKLSKVANIFKGSKKGSYLLRDVHSGIPSSGVSGGVISLVQGSYEYYHYLQEGFDDSGWGCAYRSLQTIISWFRLQHYTSVDVPSHREIQEALVDIGDKDPSFIGSREWIGAIELSYVLDKLLGVTCKVLNVRSGAELPEKCRELALHFENQGTPIMIGGGVLAYTLLGVDYNDVSGDCAFLILDPHYTGSDDRKKIVNGGWCGWKKAIDNKGKSFFLHDKFYNLLLPQRLDMV